MPPIAKLKTCKICGRTNYGDNIDISRNKLCIECGPALAVRVAEKQHHTGRRAMYADVSRQLVKDAEAELRAEVGTSPGG